MHRRSLTTLLVMMFVGTMCATSAYAANSRSDISQGSHGYSTSTGTTDSGLEGTSTNTTDSDSGETSTITCTGGECFGTDSGEVIQESIGDDQIYGMGGDDEIRGYTYDEACGFECTYDAPDTDVLSGGDGSDLVDAGDADTLDTVSGGEGSNDTCAITVNTATGTSDTLGGGCESVTVYYATCAADDPTY